MILLSVSMTLLLLRNSLIPLHQSLNFILLLSNYPGSGTMFLGILACTFLLFTASAVNIFVSVHSSSLEASSVILRDSSHSDNVLILFVLLELILFHLDSFHYTCFVLNR